MASSEQISSSTPSQHIEDPFLDQRQTTQKISSSKSKAEGSTKAIYRNKGVEQSTWDFAANLRVKEVAQRSQRPDEDTHGRCKEVYRMSGSKQAHHIDYLIHHPSKTKAFHLPQSTRNNKRDRGRQARKAGRKQKLMDELEQ